MSSAPDPLRVLMHALTTKKEIYLLAADQETPAPDLASAEFVSLPLSGQDRLVLPKSTPTRYKIDDTSTYDLQSLLFCALAKDESVGEYLQKAAKAGVQFITALSRQSVLDLLYGRREAGPEVDLLPERPLLFACRSKS
jgi:hypothetical protein